MGECSHLLLLLVPVLSLCGATDYYVRPTDEASSSFCPAGRPCLTLNQYTNESDRYFTSNTVFKFLPGTHHLDRPVIIRDVQNVSLERFGGETDEHPNLVTMFSCQCVRYGIAPILIPPECFFVQAPTSDNSYSYMKFCAAIELLRVENVTVREISLTIATENASTIILVKNALTVHLQVKLECAIPDTEPTLGIFIIESDFIDIQSSVVENCDDGINVLNSRNIHITDSTLIYCESGLFLTQTRDVHITNTTSIQGYRLLYTFRVENLYLLNICFMPSTHISLLKNTNTFIVNVTSLHSGIGMSIHSCVNTSIINSTLMQNGEAGIDIFRSVQTRVINSNLTTVMTISESQSTIISNSYFSNIDTSNVVHTTNPLNLPAAIVLHQSTLYLESSQFSRNSISAIKSLLGSSIRVTGNLIFSNNQAISGTAFILAQNSSLILSEESHIYFKNNHAFNSGGVFYIVTELSLVKSELFFNRYSQNLYLYTPCFLTVEGYRSSSRFTFVNNTARNGGDILYGGLVALGWDGHWNCLLSFKNISNISQSGLSLISSDPSRVCLCNTTGHPDCQTVTHPLLHTVFPGQTLNIPAVLVGQDFGTVAGSVFAQLLRNPLDPSPLHMESWQRGESVTQHHCTSLNYTIFSQVNDVSETAIVLTAENRKVTHFISQSEQEIFHKAWNECRRVLIGHTVYYSCTANKERFVLPQKVYEYPVYLNISVLPCPPGFMLTTEPPFRCTCNQLLQQLGRIKCRIQDQTITRSGLVWVGMFNDTNQTVAVSKYCPYDYCEREEQNVTLSHSDSQCQYHHSGVLCGACQPGLSLALGSAQCLPCSNKYLALVLPFSLAGVALVFFIKLLDLTISQGTINGLIFYANIIKANEYIFIPEEHTNPLTIFIAWLNLDLGIETCFYHGLTAYAKTWLQFVFPLYIWMIAGLLIVMAKYSDRVAKLMGNNSVPVLATLFLLSYAKLFRTIIKVLSYTMLHTTNGTKAVWSTDGNLEYLGPKHAPLFVVAVTALIFLWLPYTLLLFLGQWLHRCKVQLVSRMMIKTKPFLDAHHGPLTGKLRHWFGMLLIVRAIILLISAFVPENRATTVIACIAVAAVVLTYYGHRVYSNVAISMFDMSFFMNLALLGVITLFIDTAGGNIYIASYTLIGVAFVQFVSLLIFKVLSIFKRSKKIMACLGKGEPSENDWELYEQAAAQREMEADGENCECQEPAAAEECNESLPTYGI